MVWAILAIVLVAVVFDLRKREIPDSVSLVLLAAAVIATSLDWHEIGWLGLFGGAALGLAVSVGLFALGGLGGGDVKLLTALGAALGPAALLQSLFWIAVAGGVLAAIAALRGKRDFAYGPAIALGLLAHLISAEKLVHAFGS
jgi:prepilin peptidase CpaA